MELALDDLHKINQRAIKSNENGNKCNNSELSSDIVAIIVIVEIATNVSSVRLWFNEEFGMVACHQIYANVIEADRSIHYRILLKKNSITQRKSGEISDRPIKEINKEYAVNG